MNHINLARLLVEQTLNPADLDAAKAFAENLPGNSASETMSEIEDWGTFAGISPLYWVPGLIAAFIFRKPLYKGLAIGTSRLITAGKYKRLLEYKNKLDNGQLQRDLFEIETACKVIQEKKVAGTNTYVYNLKTRKAAAGLETHIRDLNKQTKKGGSVDRNLIGSITQAARNAIRNTPDKTTQERIVLDVVNTLADGNAATIRKTLPKISQSLGYTRKTFTEWESALVNPETKNLGISKKHNLYNTYQKQWTGKDLTHEEWGQLPGNKGRGLSLNDYYAWVANL
jgi:hypothetical protein